MNRTIWDYDIQSDAVALLIRWLCRFIFIFLTPAAVFGLIFFLWALFAHTPQTDAEKAEDHLRFRQALEAQQKRDAQYRRKRDLEYFSR